MSLTVKRIAVHGVEQFEAVIMLGGIEIWRQTRWSEGGAYQAGNTEYWRRWGQLSKSQQKL